MNDRWDDLVLVGRVARPHGIRGHVIVNPETDYPDERFQAGQRLFVRRDGRVQELTVTAVRFHQGRPIVALAGCATASDAEALAGLDLRIASEELRPLPAGTFYRHDLVGCRVRTREGVEVGEVTAVEGAVQGSRLVVAGRRGEILVPFTGAICLSVEPSRREVVIDPPEGLLDLNETRASLRHAHGNETGR